MTTALVEREPDLSSEVMEKALLGGDLAKLSPGQRLSLYHKVCESLGLNPLTRPFEYIVLNNKLQLYAKRDCTDQLRKLHGISVTVVERGKSECDESVYVVRAQATLPTGRADESLGAVAIANLKGENLANALMKAETKAKRRVTLSICGLGWLDETEVDTIRPPARDRGMTMTQLRAEDAERKALPTGELVDTATGEILVVEPPPALDISPDPVVLPVLPDGQFWIQKAWTEKSGTSEKGVPWTLYRVRVDEIDLATFSSTVYKAAQDCIKRELPAAIETKTKREKVGPEIVKLTVMQRPNEEKVF